MEPETEPTQPRIESSTPPEWLINIRKSPDATSDTNIGAAKCIEGCTSEYAREIISLEDYIVAKRK